MGNIKVTIDGIDVDAPAGSTILEAARLAHIAIPTLCYLKDLNEIGACRMCVVEVKGAKSLVASCVHPVSPNMEVRTDTPDVVESRRQTLDLLCSKHRMDCEYCVRYSDCELQALCRAYGVDEKQYSMCTPEADYEDSADHLIRDNSKCILCRRCVAACRKNQHVGVTGVFGRGFDTRIGSALPLADTACVHCGQCITVCPTGALTERDDTRKVWMAINHPAKHVIACISPFVGAQLGECFLEPVGTPREGKMIAILRRLGFDRVFTVDNAAVTVGEESAELLSRLKDGGKLPMLTSSCPGWVTFCETYYPELLENVSTSKTPQQMMGALCKNDYAEKTGIDPKDIFVVSIDPCTAEKFECRRPEMATCGHPDIDVALTTRELAAMIKRACVSNYTSLKVWRELPDEVCDPFPGIASVAGHTFGANGGFMESTLSKAYETLTGKEPLPLDFTAVRSNEAIREAELDFNDTKVKVAIVSGLANAAKLLDMVKAGKTNFTFIEVMACPGGCLNGGGQPRQPGSVHNFTDLKADRARTLYSKDAAMKLRKSNTTPDDQQLYKECLSEPNSPKARKLLHTTDSSAADADGKGQDQ
jgi:NADP-reducing hydrogenase subunit HndD